MYKIRLYILDAENHAVEIDSFMEWAQRYEPKQIARTQVGETVVSTVFLPTDHRLHGDGPPLLFETMIFGGPLDRCGWRYSSWDDAEVGHQVAVRKARAALEEAPAAGNAHEDSSLLLCRLSRKRKLSAGPATVAAPATPAPEPAACFARLSF